ncbi:MAG: PEP-CTERM sorting domain-containing protein, partial [Armatimonadetes bacterium]|nr:PEP-CTERM sorting domain-containing protein [Armatimonadota bacterium]
YQLTDTGLNSSLVTTWLCFNNTGQNTYNIDTFFAMDLDLMGTFGGDQGLPLQNLSAGKLITTVEGGDTGMMLGPGAIGSGLGLNSQILSALTNNVVNTWNPDISNPGPGDLEDLMQFHNIVPPGQQVCVPMYIGVGINNQIPTLPEPGSLVALGFGAVAIMRRRK